MSQIDLQMSCFFSLVMKTSNDSVVTNLSDVALPEGILSATDVLSASFCAIDHQPPPPQHRTSISTAGSFDYRFGKVGDDHHSLSRTLDPFDHKFLVSRSEACMILCKQ
jgi:hypothetical protein